MSVSKRLGSRRPLAGEAHSMLPVNVEIHNAWVEFPTFDAKRRSLKKAFLGSASRAI